MPPQLLQFFPLQLVIYLILPELFHPEISSGLGYICQFAPFVVMPEAAIHEDDCLIFGKYHIRLAGIAGIIFPESEPCTKESTSNNDFLFCVTVSYVTHVFMSLLFSQNIHVIPLKNSPVCAGCLFIRKILFHCFCYTECQIYRNCIPNLFVSISS